MSGKAYQRHGRWWISYRFRGQEVRQSVARVLGRPPQEISELDAKRCLQARLADIATQRFVGAREERLTVAQVIDEWLLALETRRAKSLRTLRAHSAHPKRLLGHLRASTLRAADLDAYVRQRRDEGLSDGSLHTEIGEVMAALNLARKRERLARVPARPTLPMSRARQGFLEPDQFQAIGTHLAPADRAFAEFAYYTGWRPNEIAGLRWAWVDHREHELRVPDTKNGRPKSTPLPGPLWAIIERRWEARKVGDRLADHVFHVAGRPVSSTHWCRMWRAACTAAGLGGWIFYDLKRSALRNMIRAGVEQTVAKRIAGIVTDSIFARYNITSREDKLDALAKVHRYVQERTT